MARFASCLSLRESLSPILSPSRTSAAETLSLADVVQFSFSPPANPTRATISLVTRSFLRARQVIFRCRPFLSLVLSSPYLSRSSRRNCRGSRVTAINFPAAGDATINRRRSFHGVDVAHSSSETESLLQRNTIPRGPVRRENSFRANKIYAGRCRAPMSSVSHLQDPGWQPG